jgi:hypothetical protein
MLDLQVMLQMGLDFQVGLNTVLQYHVIVEQQMIQQHHSQAWDQEK